MKKNFFISYDSQNRDFADGLAKSLKEQGFQTFVSSSDLRLGNSWLETLRANLKTTDGFILVMPKRGAATSNSAFFETGAARALGKKVVVVVPDIEAVDRSNIPFDLASTVVVDASKQSLKSVAATIVGAIEDVEPVT